MEFKFRANIVMSRELTVEADHLSDALDKVREIMAKPVPRRELTPTKLYFDVISPIK